MCWIERELLPGVTVDQGIENRHCFFQMLDHPLDVKEGEMLKINLYYRDKPFFTLIKQES